MSGTDLVESGRLDGAASSAKVNFATSGASFHEMTDNAPVRTYAFFLRLPLLLLLFVCMFFPSPVMSARHRFGSRLFEKSCFPTTGEEALVLFAAMSRGMRGSVVFQFTFVICSVCGSSFLVVAFRALLPCSAPGYRTG